MQTIFSFGSKQRTFLSFEESLKNVKRIMKFENVDIVLQRTHIYGGRREKSQYISNLIYITSCFFIPSQYDVY
jgi:hypothetical protein